MRFGSQLSLQRELRDMHGALLGHPLTADRVRAVMGEAFTSPTPEQEISLRMMHGELGEAWDAEDMPAIEALLQEIL